MSQEQASVWFGKYAKIIITLLATLGRFRRWFFIKGTRVVEGMNAIFLLCFSVAFFVDYDHINDLPTFSKFNIENDKFYWAAMFLWGCLQIYAMTKVSIRSNIGSSIVLVVSAFIWVLISALMYSAVEQRVPLPYMIFAFACFCAMAGYEMLTQNKKQEDQIKQKIKQVQANAGV